jgi:hypothetical protein
MARLEARRFANSAKTACSVAALLIICTDADVPGLLATESEPCRSRR